MSRVRLACITKWAEDPMHILNYQFLLPKLRDLLLHKTGFKLINPRPVEITVGNPRIVR